MAGRYVCVLTIFYVFYIATVGLNLCNISTTIYHRLRKIASAVGKDFNLRLAKNKVNIYQVNAKIMQCHVLLCKKELLCFMSACLLCVYNIKIQMIQTVL